MSVRVLTNPSTPVSRFPRWGYLDRYGVDEYLARAFLLTLGLVAILGLGTRTWLALRGGHSAAVPVPRPAPPVTTVNLGPPPSIQPTGGGRGTGGKVVVERVHGAPVPVPAPTVVVDPFDVGSGPGPGVEGAIATLADGPGAIGIVEEAPHWPSPEEIVVVEREPVLIAMRAPEYPEIARDAGIEGTVLVRVLVDPRGAVHDAHVLQGVRGLDEAALAAATTAVFRPALQQDRPVAVWVVVPIEFSLHD